MITLVYLLHQTVRLTDFMMNKTMGFSEDTTNDSVTETASPVGLVAPPRPLDLALSPRSLRAIAAAEAAFDQLVRDHEVSEIYCLQPFCLQAIGLMLLFIYSIYCFGIIISLVSLRLNPHKMEVFEFHGYGIDEIKRFKISPDAFVQMALQLGVFKMTGASARRFHNESNSVY